MRILFAHQLNDLYGASRSLLRLATRLRLDGHHVLVLLPYDGPLTVKLTQAGILVRFLPELFYVDRVILRSAGCIGLGRRLTSSVSKILRIIREHRIDVVHTNTALILSSGLAARLRGIPHVWHVREIFSEHPRLWKMHRHLMLRLASRVVCVSQAVADQFDGLAATGKVCVVHNGIPAQEACKAPARVAEEFRQRFAMSSGPVVGTIGRINLRRKGQGTLMEAARTLVSEFPQAKFLIAGTSFPGKEENLLELKRLISALGLEKHVVCTGELDQVQAFYQACDMTVLAVSLPDAFPGVVLESMAMARPVVASRLGGTTEQIVDGETGYLVEPDQPVALAAAIRRLLADPRLCLEMGIKARHRFLEKFEFEQCYRKILALYESLVSSEVRAETPVEGPSLAAGEPAVSQPWRRGSSFRA